MALYNQHVYIQVAKHRVIPSENCRFGFVNAITMDTFPPFGYCCEKGLYEKALWKPNWNGIMNHGMYARAAMWFADICSFFNKCCGVHSGSALASFVIIYVGWMEYSLCVV